MSFLTVEGIYKNGKIELAEHPDNIGEAARVLVTFLLPGAAHAETTLGEHHDRETLRQQAFARMKEGFHLGGDSCPAREEVYDLITK